MEMQRRWYFTFEKNNIWYIYFAKSQVISFFFRHTECRKRFQVQVLSLVGEKYAYACRIKVTAIYERDDKIEY